jgi:hypothetical protein
MAANYPTADPSFSAKSPGQQIQSAHVNALQDEVVAIGAALRGTLQHNVTIANSLSVSSNASVSGLVSAPAQPRCLLVSTAANAMSSGTFTAVDFLSEDYDVGGLHSTAVNPSRITIPAGSSGLYLVGARLVFANSANARGARLLKNSTTSVGSLGVAQGTVNGASVSLSTPVVLDGGDWVEVQGFCFTSTGSLVADGTNRYNQSEFWAVKVW